MRALLLAVLCAACAPRTGPAAVSPDFDEDLGQAAPAAPPPTAAPTAAPASAPAPAHHGKALRSGTIARAHLLAVLDAGPGRFLRQLEVTPRMNGDKFVGWQLVQLLDHTGPLADLDVVPGDVLLAINGQRLARPDDLQALWDSLRTADALVAELTRDGAPLTLRFTIEPQVGK